MASPVEKPDNENLYSREPLPLDAGEIVTLNLGNARTDCLVFQRTGANAILTPLEVSKDLESAIKNLPATGQIITDSGKSSNFSINSQHTLLAFDGDLGQVDCVENQRQWYRVHLNYKLQVSVNGKSWSTMCGENISEGGLLASSHKRLDFNIGQALFMRIFLPGMEPLIGSGIVRKIDIMHPDTPQATAKVRIKWTEMSVRESHRLTQFIYQCQYKADRA